MTPHPDFRLWLTTEQHANFPTIILQQSLKTTFEAPPGLQQNLARTYESLMHKEFVERGPSSRAQLPTRAAPDQYAAMIHTPAD